MKTKLSKIPANELTWYAHCFTVDREIDDVQFKTFGPVQSREAALNLSTIHSATGKYTHVEINQNPSGPILVNS